MEDEDLKRCSVKGCATLAWQADMCAVHRRRVARYGDPNYIYKRKVIHQRAVSLAYRALYRRGYKVKAMPFIGCKFDLLVNGKVRIEVKSAEPRKGYKGAIFWGINIHRHGVVARGATDFYWIVLFNVPLIRRPLHILLSERAIGDTKTYNISLAEILERGSRVDFGLIEKEAKANG